jgi:hypothetical protein
MLIHNNREDDYGHKNRAQARKDDSIAQSKKLVNEVKALFKPYLQSCEEYEPEDDLKISGAPAVKIGDKLVIAPDLKCISKDGIVFWIEVKDKCQRFYKPDTGADLHQVLGWYQINKQLKEPVLLIFQDSTIEKCTVKKPTNMDDTTYKNLKESFEGRWGKFNGKLYGNWLQVCIKKNTINKYPIIAEERSRDMSMTIAYFHLDTMMTIEEGIESLVAEAKNNCQIDGLEVFHDQSWKNFNEINRLSIGD